MAGRTAPPGRRMDTPAPSSRAAEATPNRDRRHGRDRNQDLAVAREAWQDAGRGVEEVAGDQRCSFLVRQRDFVGPVVLLPQAVLPALFLPPATVDLCLYSRAQ